MTAIQRLTNVEELDAAVVELQDAEYLKLPG